MKCLEQVLEIKSDMGDGLAEATTYSAMCDVLLAQREKEAIEILHKVRLIYSETTGDDAETNLSDTFRSVGKAYREIGAWKNAIYRSQRPLKMKETVVDCKANPVNS